MSQRRDRAGRVESAKSRSAVFFFDFMRNSSVWGYVFLLENSKHQALYTIMYGIKLSSASGGGGGGKGVLWFGGWNHWLQPRTDIGLSRLAKVFDLSDAVTGSVFNS